MILTQTTFLRYLRDVLLNWTKHYSSLFTFSCSSPRSFLLGTACVNRSLTSNSFLLLACNSPSWKRKACRIPVYFIKLSLHDQLTYTDPTICGENTGWPARVKWIKHNSVSLERDWVWIKSHQIKISDLNPPNLLTQHSHKRSYVLQIHRTYTIFLSMQSLKTTIDIISKARKEPKIVKIYRFAGYGYSADVKQLIVDRGLSCPRFRVWEDN